jgi:hypothetical protein
MRNTTLFLIPLIVQFNFCFGQNDTIMNKSCETASIEAIKAINEGKLSIIQFGLLDETSSFYRLLSLYGITTDYKNCSIEYEDAISYSCYNNEIEKHIDSIYGQNFLERIKRLSEMMDELGLGDRIPHPVGKINLRKYLDEKVQSSNLDITSINNKIIRFLIQFDKQGNIKSIIYTSGDQILFDFIKGELLKLSWTNATNEGIPYEMEFSMAYVYIDE